MKLCFACGRKLGKNPHLVACIDEQIVHVGSECFKLIGPTGWQPPKGGPRLFRIKVAPDGTVLEVIGRPDHPSVGKPSGQKTFSAFDQAYKLMPACLVGAVDRPKTISDLRFAALHEIDCFEEGQDGHLTAAEIAQVRRFLTFLSRS